MTLENGSLKYMDLDNQIIDCVIYEKTNDQIAEETGYSSATIKLRLGKIFKQYGVKTKTGLVREIFKSRLMEYFMLLAELV